MAKIGLVYNRDTNSFAIDREYEQGVKVASVKSYSRAGIFPSHVVIEIPDNIPEEKEDLSAKAPKSRKSNG